MKKSIQRFLASFLAVIVLTLSISVASYAAGQPKDLTYQMGQVDIHFLGIRVGGDSLHVAIDLNGYMPQTISEKITGDFTEADLRKSHENWAVFATQTVKTHSPISPLISCPVLNENPYSTEQIWTLDYSSNIYKTRWTLTEVAYAIIPPADLPVKSITFSVDTGNAALYYDRLGSMRFVQTTHWLYLDGQLFLEYSMGTGKGDAWYKIHQANFQAIEPNKTETARPTTSKIFIDGKQVDLGAYFINNNNYVKLRDVAYVLNGSSNQFNAIWHSATNTIEVHKRTPYVPVGGEMQPLSDGSVSAFLSSAIITFKGENPYIDPYNEYFLPKAYNIGGNNYYKLRDIAQIIGFTVDWDATTNNVIITTTT